MPVTLKATHYNCYLNPLIKRETCGGDFDRATRHYTDNVVVYAVPLQRTRPSSPR